MNRRCRALRPPCLYMNRRCWALRPPCLHMNRRCWALRPPCLHMNRRCWALRPPCLHMNRRCRALRPPCLHMNRRCWALRPPCLHMTRRCRALRPPCLRARPPDRRSSWSSIFIVALHALLGIVLDDVAEGFWIVVALWSSAGVGGRRAHLAVYNACGCLAGFSSSRGTALAARFTIARLLLILIRSVLTTARAGARRRGGNYITIYKPHDAPGAKNTHLSNAMWQIRMGWGRTRPHPEDTLGDWHPVHTACPQDRPSPQPAAD